MPRANGVTPRLMRNTVNRGTISTFFHSIEGEMNKPISKYAAVAMLFVMFDLAGWRLTAIWNWSLASNHPGRKNLRVLSVAR